MNTEAGTVVLTLALFLVAKISSVNEPGKLNNHILQQTVQAAQPPVSTFFFLQPELLYLQWYVETQWSIVVDLTQR